MLLWQSNCGFQTTVTCTTCQLQGSLIYWIVYDSIRRCRRRADDIAWTGDSSHNSLRMRWSSAVFYIQSYFTFDDSPLSRSIRRCAGDAIKGAITSKTSCGAKAQQTPSTCCASHGHSTPSLKISCKSVQPFSRNLANKETKIHTYIQTKKSIENNTSSPQCIGGGIIKHAIELKLVLQDMHNCCSSH